MKVHLRYCSMWNYEPHAVSLAEKLLATYKQKIQGLELEPSGGGCFELAVGGDLVYSKLKTGKFPDEEEMVRAVGNRLK